MITFGFYNSENGDRKYDATDISELFDGVINDGIFQSIGSQLIVSATTGMIVNVGTGRAWFNKTWTLNDAPEALNVTASDLILDRIDTVVLEVDSSVAVRTNTVKIVEGTPSGSPVAPTLSSGATLNQYPLADIYVAAAVTEILAQDITNRVGTVDTPFVTGILETVDISALLVQWEAEFDAWFQTVKDQLDGDAAGNLLLMIQDINKPKGVTVTNQEIAFGLESATGDTETFMLELAAEVTGGPITCKKATDAAKPLVEYDGTPVESAGPGYIRVVEKPTVFHYASGSSGGTSLYGGGEDGDLNTTGDVVLSAPVEDDSPIIKKYKSITINAGHKLYSSNRNMGLILYCEGDVVIDGEISNSFTGGVFSKTSRPHIPEILDLNDAPLAACGKGGLGGHKTAGPADDWDSNPERYYSLLNPEPIPFSGGRGGGGDGGWGYYTTDNDWSSGADIDNAGGIGIPIDIQRTRGNAGAGGRGTEESGGEGLGGYSYGAGGGGGGASSTSGGTASDDGDDGQGAGGIIVIIAAGDVTINGILSTEGSPGGKGGDAKGSNPNYGGCGGGGAGGGGITIVHKGALTNNGTITMNGGAGGAGGANGGPGGNNIAGDAGTAGSLLTYSADNDDILT